jgi:hypothetical protein
MAKPVVSIFTYDRPRELELLHDDLYEEGARIYLFDDYSPKGVDPLIIDTVDIYYRTERNHGQKERWVMWNVAFTHALMSGADRFIFLPDDCRVCPNFVATSMDILDKLPLFSALSLWVISGREGADPRDPGFAVHPGPGGTVESGWIDGCFACRRDFLELLEWRADETAYGLNFAMSQRALNAGARLFRVDRSLVKHTGKKSKMSPHLTKKKGRDLCSLRPVW